MPILRNYPPNGNFYFQKIPYACPGEYPGFTFIVLAIHRIRAIPGQSPSFFASMTIPARLVTILLFSGAGASVAQEVKVLTGHSITGTGFKLDPVPPPAVNDAAAGATFTLLDGTSDRNSPGLAVLHDGLVPADADQPNANFFLAQGSPGGRVAIDLGKVIPVQSVATYSWHPAERAPQVYIVYAAEGTEKDFNAAPKRDADPASCGWRLLAKVDTRPKHGEAGGQHGVAITAGTAPLGKFRHLIFDIRPSSEQDRFGQTFFSEIDVIEAGGPEVKRIQPQEKVIKTFVGTEGKTTFVIDATDAPDLADWAEKKLLPVVQEWYPKMSAMLTSDGYSPPKEVLLQFKNGINVPAFASGNQITLNAPWFRGELDREARGCVVHELVHVVQNYWRAGVRNPKAAKNPGWIVEGIPDYIRWFLYEPQSQGANITARTWEKAKYDDSYRTSANFLDWVARTHPGDVIKKLNAACRAGNYSADLWKDWTGLTLEELGAAWKKAHAERLGIKPAR